MPPAAQRPRGRRAEEPRFLFSHLDSVFFGRRHMCLSLTAAWTGVDPELAARKSARSPPLRGKQWLGLQRRAVGKCWLTGANGGTSGKGQDKKE